MKVSRIVCIVLLIALNWVPAHGQVPDLALGAPITRDIAPTESHLYSVQARAGDLVSGRFTLRDVAGSLSVLDPSNATIKMYVLDEPQPSQELRVGFLAPTSATYRIRVSASGTTRGSYLLLIDRAATADRLRGVLARPRDVYPSDRVGQLARAIQDGQSGAVARFWQDVTGHTPFVEPLKGNEDEVLVTFLWKERYETQNVLLLWPPTTQGRAEEYYLSHLAGTDVWYKTIRLRRGSRFTYAFSPNDRPEDRTVTSQQDPLNPRRWPEEVGAAHANARSVLELPGAPDETSFRRVPSSRGHVEQRVLQSTLLKGERGLVVYTPPAYRPDAGPFPLVLLFDGLAYLEEIWGNRALQTLDNLVSEKRIRPPVVCFVDTSQYRPSDLGGFGEAFGRAITEELMPLLRSSYAVGRSPRDVVIGGFSTGGKTAALIALKRPDLFGNVLSQSGAFQQSLPPQGNTSTSAEPNALAQMYLAAATVPVRFYLEYGLYERMSNSDRPLDQLVVDEAMTVANRHFRDVLIAKGYDVTYRETGTGHENIHWRSTLADGLIKLLSPAP